MGIREIGNNMQTFEIISALVILSILIAAYLTHRMFPADIVGKSRTPSLQIRQTFDDGQESEHNKLQTNVDDVYCQIDHSVV